MDERAVPHTPPPQSVPRRLYALDGRERALLPLALVLGIFAADLALFSLWDFPALGVFVLWALWYAALFWYGGARRFLARAHLPLFLAAALLALTFLLFSNRWLRSWNLLALPLLTVLHTFGAAGGTRYPWSSPLMLPERIGLLFSGLFTRVGASGQAAASLKGRCSRRGIWILAGALIAAVLVAVLLPLLSSADAFFQYVTGGAATWFALHAPGWTLRAVLGFCAAPFLFSLFYALRRPQPLNPSGRPLALPKADPAAPVVVLVVLNLLYLFFLAVQLTALFGGEAYLARAGISYAEYARSGFFQLVGAAALNLTVLLCCLALSPREGRGGRLVRLLSTLLIALSAVLLLSAAWRMTLYVGTYGLSFKRLLTYWGMVMLALLFTAALLAAWKSSFSFFRFLFTAAVAGWRVLNFMNPDALIARCNVALSRSNPQMQVDVDYMASLSYDALPALENLSRDHPDARYLRWVINGRRFQAADEASRWQSWSLSAQLAAHPRSRS